MRQTVRSISSLFTAAALFVVAACEKPDVILPPHIGGKEEPVETVAKPAECTNKIVAHRGGSAECGAPDNSIAALRYAMSLKLYASECDIYWTADNQIVVGHADGQYRINGLVTWEHTLKQIKDAGKLSNGETVSSLEEYLDVVMEKGSCTRLQLDIKVTSPADYAVKAVQRACEIIKDKNAQHFCEFICTSNTTVGKAAAACMASYNIPVGWMSNNSPAIHKAYGFDWANLSAKSYMIPYGSRTIDEFKKAGMQISVYNVDKVGSTDGNAVTSESDVNYYLQNYESMRCIVTNYPKWLMSKLNL